MLLKLLENHLTFKPTSDYYPELIPEECTFKTISSDQFDIQVVYNLRSKDTICINCHGNASNISNLLPLYNFYDHGDFSYLLFDYPGYGESTGSPSEQNFYDSLDLIIEFVRSELGFEDHQIVLHGISLGGAVAIEGLSKYNFRAAVIDASFTSNKGMAKYMFPSLPLHKLIKPRFNSIEKIKSIQTPILFIHGQDDEVIPWEMTQELYDAKPGEKDILILPHVAHNDDAKVTLPECINRFNAFISSER